MKTLRPIPILPCLAVALWISPSGFGATTIPTDLALPTSTVGEKGLVVRVVQAPEEPAVANSYLRAIRQIQGTLTDDAGAPVPDEALPGNNSDGSHDVDELNFERDALPFELYDLDGNFLWVFEPDWFPGIPGTGGHTTHFALEAVAYVQLSPGAYTMGVTVGTDRTDVNDDDGYQVFVGTNPRDFFNLKVGEFQRFAPPFQSDTKNESQFEIMIEKEGVYPFRLVYWQTGRGASLQWYMIDPDNGARLLINESDAGATPAFRTSSVPETTSPYVGEVSPLPGSAGNDRAAPIKVVLLDGDRPVDDASVVLKLNGAVVELTKERAGNVLRITHQPTSEGIQASNEVEVEYAEAGGPVYAVSWSFDSSVVGGETAPVAGQWDFDEGDLAATVGVDLAYLDPLTEAGTRFGTTTSFGIADIGGEPAQVMFVPGDRDRRIGYVMDHGIAPNGGGTRVNQYTLIMDVYVEREGGGAAALLQISSPANTDDGDLFWQGGNFGQGGDGYRGKGAFTANEWHRMAAAYDMAADPPVVVKYVDGIKQDDWTANQGLDNARRALLPTAVLFADGDADERSVMYVNCIQIRAGRLSDAQLAALGAPSTDGIPPELAESNATGQWDFNHADLSATIGKGLAYLDGAEGETAIGTRFGITGEDDFSDVPDIAGDPAAVMYVPGDLSNKIGYVMEHLIPPNGGGTRVNQYTLVYDVLVGEEDSGAAAMLQISSPANTDDGDLFWQGGNFGQGSGGYGGEGTFTAGEWHRVVAAYDMAADPPVVVKYVDGIFQDNWTANQGLDNARRALLPTAVLFADGDADERREWWVNSVQIRSKPLSNAEIEWLGGPSAAGIPVVIDLPPPPTPPELSITLAESEITISWPADVEGFTLESIADLGGSDWVEVPGVEGNSVTVSPENVTAFYRLRR